MNDKVKHIHPTNVVHEKLDDAISGAILGMIEAHNVTNSDIVGVMECIKFRILDSGEIMRTY